MPGSRLIPGGQSIGRAAALPAERVLLSGVVNAPLWWAWWALCVMLLGLPCTATDMSGQPGALEADHGADTRRALDKEMAQSLAMEYFERAAKAARHIEDDVQRHTNLYFMVQERLERGRPHAPEAFVELMNECFPERPLVLRPYELGDLYYRILVAHAVRHGKRSLYLRAVEVAREGTEISEDGVRHLGKLANVMAAAGEYAWAAHLFCEAIQQSRGEVWNASQRVDLFVLMGDAVQIWSKGGGYELLDLAYSTAALLPEEAAAARHQGAGYRYQPSRRGSDRGVALSCVARAIHQRAMREQRLDASPASGGRISRPSAEFTSAGEETESRSNGPLRAFAHALERRAQDAHDWQWRAILTGFQGIALLAAQDIEGAVHALDSLPEDDGSQDLDRVRAGAAADLAAVAVRTGREDLLALGARVARAIRDAGAAARAYRALALGAFLLHNARLAEGFVERALLAVEVLPEYYQDTALTRLGFILLGAGQRERGLRLVDQGARAAPLGDTIWELAVWAEQLRDVSLVDYGYDLVSMRRNLAGWAEAIVWLAWVEARLGHPREALESLRAAARQVEASDKDYRVYAACQIGQALLYLGDEQAANELFQKVLSGVIRNPGSRREGEPLPGDEVAAVLAHRAGNQLDKQLARRAMDVALNHGLLERSIVITAAAYVALHTKDVDLLMEAMATASRFDNLKTLVDLYVNLGYLAGAWLDRDVIDRVTAWTLEQDTSLGECMVYRGVASGIWHALDDSPNDWFLPMFKRELPWLRLPTVETWKQWNTFQERDLYSLQALDELDEVRLMQARRD